MVHSPAVNVFPWLYEESNQGYLPIPLFKDSTFKRNHVSDKTQHHLTQGVFSVTRFNVWFQGHALFEENWYSALYLISGRVIFDKNSNVTFLSNRAINGGAVAMYGFSVIIINDNSRFHFINNSATRKGGGIVYMSWDQREYVEGKSCFLRYGGNETNVTMRNITFRFRANIAPLGGLSIYSESFYSCYFAYYVKYAHNLTKFFDSIATFYFDEVSQKHGETALATAARRVFFKRSSHMTVVPGAKLFLPLVMYDEFMSVLHSEFAVRVEHNDMVHLNNYFTVNNSTRVYGGSNQSATLVLTTPQMLYSIEYRVYVTLLPCSPGFYYDEIERSCKCSANSPSHSYPAIVKCVEFKAFIKNDYWAGYYPSTQIQPDHLYTAFYPSGFINDDGLRILPNSSSNLSDFMCGSTSEGVLCGRCKAGYSAYYHSKDMVCGRNTRACNFGILIYLLSEIVPIVVFFAIVMIFGINFSSGSLNGLVFFSQTVDIFSQDHISLQLNLHKNKPAYAVLKSGYRSIYGIFNFDYFTMYDFCLWKGATFMDVVAFKYVTVTFAFILIFFIAVVMNHSVKCHTRLRNPIFKTRRGSVTHGLSTVLNICYGQCTKVGFLILSESYLRGKHGVKEIVVTHYGGLPYFGHEHIRYAIPAITFTTLLVVLPPFCLLLYPLCLHLLELCGLSEHRWVGKISRLLCVSYFVPLFDSFQSCFKNRLRFFSGLYFLYRIVVFMDIEHFPPVLIAALMLGVHSILQPYKSSRHNLIDSFIFLNLTIISCIRITIEKDLLNEKTDSLPKFELVQLILIYLPLISFILIITFKIGKKMYRKFCKTAVEVSTATEDHETMSHADITHSSVNTPLLVNCDSGSYE